MAPKNYYQIINFWRYLDSKNIYVPLMPVLITSKNIIAYNHVFNFILQIFDDNNLKVNFKSKVTKTDHERAIRLSINSIFKPKPLNGCFLILIFCFKLFPYIHNNYRGEYIEKIKNYVKNKDKRFQKFLNYFLKNWFNNKSYNFNRISN